MHRIGSSRQGDAWSDQISALYCMLRRLPADRSKQVLGFFHEVVRRCPDEVQLLPSTGGDDQECSNWGGLMRGLAGAFEAHEARNAGLDFIVDGAPIYPSPNREAVWPITSMESRASQEQLAAQAEHYRGEARPGRPVRCAGAAIIELRLSRLVARSKDERVPLPGGKTWLGDTVCRDEWFDDIRMACGSGDILRIDGTLEYRGEVDDGVPHGKGKSYAPNGRDVVHDGVFSRGEPVPNCIFCLDVAGFGCEDTTTRGQVAVLGCATGGCKVCAPCCPPALLSAQANAPSVCILAGAFLQWQPARRRRQAPALRVPRVQTANHAALPRLQGAEPRVHGRGPA